MNPLNKEAKNEKQQAKPNEDDDIDNKLQADSTIKLFFRFEKSCVIKIDVFQKLMLGRKYI